MSSQELPERLVFRPDIDASDKASIKALAKILAAWAIAHQERVQREIAAR